MTENVSLEQFLIECRKTKTRVITVANHIQCPMNQSKLAVNSRSERKAGKGRGGGVGTGAAGKGRENEQVVIGFGNYF